jgi:NADPH:quinone reductase-like Zn-dependent oxidoreductase
VSAWNSVIEQGKIQLGDVVLIQGTGGVALFALQFARLAGATVIALSSTSEKLKRLRSLGADTVINYKESPEWDSLVRDATRGTGVDQVVDILGGVMDRSLRATKIGGLVSLVGNLAGFAITFDLASLSSHARIQDVAVGSRAMFERMNAAIAQHQLRPIIDRVFKFAEAPDAMRHLKSGRHVGKICITVSGPKEQ